MERWRQVKEGRWKELVWRELLAQQVPDYWLARRSCGEACLSLAWENNIKGRRLFCAGTWKLGSYRETLVLSIAGHSLDYMKQQGHCFLEADNRHIPRRTLARARTPERRGVAGWKRKDQTPQIKRQTLPAQTVRQWDAQTCGNP